MIHFTENENYYASLYIMIIDIEPYKNIELKNDLKLFKSIKQVKLLIYKFMYKLHLYPTTVKTLSCLTLNPKNKHNPTK